MISYDFGDVVLVPFPLPVDRTALLKMLPVITG